jgi:hypothetical protein
MSLIDSDWTEADTQFGITDKQFRFNDFNMFIADDWRVSPSLTFNVGVRYEFFGLPEEVNGRFGNVDFDAITNNENPVNAFIVPKNVQNTGFAAIDAAVATSERADNNHTLKGQDWNNVAPRLGFAWRPGESDRLVVRGGYGIFFDRPSAAFMNTVFSNYPFPNSSLGGMLDYNLANASGAVIGFEARTPVLGFNVPEAVVLKNTGRSLYNSIQFSFLKRMSDGLQFNLAYSYSRSKDTSSSDPGSTAGGGKPDVPNAGFVVQNNQPDLDANYALSDFDRPHRFSGSFVWELPGQGLLDGFRLSGFLQMQSGLPYTIFAAEPEIASAAQYTDLVRGSGGLYRTGFGRPSLCGSLDDLRQEGSDPTRALRKTRDTHFGPSLLLREPAQTA